MSVRMEWHGGRVNAQAHAGAERGVRLAAEHLLAASRLQVPLDEGTLERSGRADADGLEAAVSYDTVYAARQHEELTWHHPMPGRKAKYLEDPLNEQAAAMNEIIAAEVRRALRG